MESKYDRVDVPENLYLHSEGETEDFGTGVYPISVISRKSNFKDDTVKVACFKVRRKSRCLLLIGTVIALIILTLIIIIATNDKTNRTEVTTTMKAERKEKGLLFQPSYEDTPYIRYSVADMKTYEKYINLLQFQVYDYQAIHQQTSDYVNCLNKSAPNGKACKMTDVDFGSHCTHANEYGYREGRPCILLRLKLEDSATITPFTSSDTKIKDMLNKTGNWAENHVGVTCGGETETDRKAMGHEDFFYEDGIKDYPITYHPATGFPVWFYPKKNDKYKVPAVMVHFNTIRSHHLVTIKCVAWAKSFNGGKPQDSDIYSTRFQIYME